MDQGLHDELSTIMNENTNDIQKAFPEGSFHRVFWDQQLENSKVMPDSTDGSPSC